MTEGGTRRAVVPYLGGVPLGVHHKTLGSWVSDGRRRRARAADPASVNEAERDELRRLRKEVAELRMEREILRKAAA